MKKECFVGKVLFIFFIYLNTIFFQMGALTNSTEYRFGVKKN